MTNIINKTLAVCMFHTVRYTALVHQHVSTMVLSTIAGKSASGFEATPQPDYNYLYLAGQFTIQKYFESPLIPLLNSTQIQWYHNGTAVDAFRTNSSLERQGERLTLTLTVFNARKEMDLGLYEGVVNVDFYNFYVFTGRPSNYYSYVTNFFYHRFFYFYFQVVYFPVVIIQYGKLSCGK